MIKNDHQLQVTRNQKEKFDRAISDFQPRADVHPALIQAQLAGLMSVRDELQAEIDEYLARQTEPIALIHHCDP